MVTTRRGTANGAATNRTSKSKIANTANDAIHVIGPSRSRTQNTAATPKLSITALDPVRLDSMSEYDLSLTSPFTTDTPDKAIMSMPKNNCDPLSRQDSSSSPTLRRLMPKPAKVTGGELNPIIINDSSPLSKRARAARRKQQRQSEPHKFLDRGYRKLYSYRPSRPALAPKPANGSTFTGHKSHDIYRMMNAKMIAAPGGSVNEMPGYRSLGYYDVPFEVQYPMSAQFLTQHTGALNQRQDPSVQYYNHHTPKLNAYPLVPNQDEEMLRKKAVQYVREYSRPSARKRRLSDADPDETSTSESEHPAEVVRPSVLSSTARPGPASLSWPLTSEEGLNNRKLAIHHDNDPNSDITQITEHTSLLTSLLQLYPHSTNQKGIREDIAMLVSVQNQRVKEWMKIESQNARKRRKSNTDSTISVSHRKDGSVQSAMATGIRAQQQLEQEKRKGQDDEMRRVFSATANMWQDGSGQGVADVFANARSSSPTPRFDGKLASSSGMRSSLDGKISSPRSRTPRLATTVMQVE
ncbi:uncharacterized protein K460DRAFT_419221 [Cucurbitaria berberidis CBS 394.84]|uniref:Uncharacterized protein n=1 Tax=Cucurbitaria berberidis CBS 394.84 TaxID=1168544 RepID=A0A9P4GE47_9PLEO|nr:uncharacterized protein K460DRAFT_419221 [Cucurbitaria berberidis CBS 394.84]KAF1844293.1 hypothetical protein K460DRAFT_419221 [Cucurbitaria berberidis CBS 394.84]